MIERRRIYEFRRVRTHCLVFECVESLWTFPQTEGDRSIHRRILVAAHIPMHLDDSSLMSFIEHEPIIRRQANEFSKLDLVFNGKFPILQATEVALNCIFSELAIAHRRSTE